MTRRDPTFEANLFARLRAQSDDGAAWAEFVQVYAPRILHWCHRWGLQEADAGDITQMALLRFWNQLPRFEYDPDGNFLAWLRALAHATRCDFLAQQRHKPRAEGGDGGRERLKFLIVPDSPIGEFDLELLDRAVSLVRARVHGHTWEAFQLLALDGLSGEEAATRLGMKRGSVFAARAKVQRLLRETLQQLTRDDDQARAHAGDVASMDE